MPSKNRGPTLLSPTDIAQFQSEGFVRLADMFPISALNEVRELLDPLFENPDKLPKGMIQDLASVESSRDPLQSRSPEINRAVRVEPRLARTHVFAICKQLGEELAGRRLRYSFDHAIYKRPFNEAETPWHQDQAYTGHLTSLNTIHFWIPLQDATIENGCMHFVPGSHRLGLLPHGRGEHQSPVRTLTEHRELLSEATACPVAAGGLTAHTPFTLHFTGPNRTSEQRRAWILHFGPLGRWAKLHPLILAQRILGLVR